LQQGAVFPAINQILHTLTGEGRKRQFTNPASVSRVHIPISTTNDKTAIIMNFLLLIGLRKPNEFFIYLFLSSQLFNQSIIVILLYGFADSVPEESTKILPSPA
jgi:hypothetical protein